jgi:hypothetical protein
VKAQPAQVDVDRAQAYSREDATCRNVLARPLQQARSLHGEPTKWHGGELQRSHEIPAFLRRTFALGQPVEPTFVGRSRVRTGSGS